MAMQIVASRPEVHTRLTVDQVDRIDELRTKAAAIVDLVGAASGSGDIDPLSIPNACWAATDALNEIKSIMKEAAP